MNTESDLVSIKLKRRRRSSNPIFDEDMLAELAENYDQEKLNEGVSNNPNTARSFILGKKFRRNMIRCLNKMKSLKLTPKEVTVLFHWDATITSSRLWKMRIYLATILLRDHIRRI